jgi:hypothetical protein
VPQSFVECLFSTRQRHSLPCLFCWHTTKSWVCHCFFWHTTSPEFVVCFFEVHDKSNKKFSSSPSIYSTSYIQHGVLRFKFWYIYLSCAFLSHEFVVCFFLAQGKVMSLLCAFFKRTSKYLKKFPLLISNFFSTLYIHFVTSLYLFAILTN